MVIVVYIVLFKLILVVIVLSVVYVYVFCRYAAVIKSAYKYLLISLYGTSI